MTSTPLQEPARSLLALLAAVVTSRPRQVAAVVVAASLVAGLVAATGLGLRPGYVDLLDPRSPVQARYLALLEEFGNVEALHVLVSGDAARAAAVADRLAAELPRLEDANGAPLVERVLARVDLAWLAENAPAFLPAQALDVLTGGGSDGPLPRLLAHPGAPQAIDLVTEGVHAVTEGRPGAEWIGEASVLPLLAEALTVFASRVESEDAPPLANGLALAAMRERMEGAAFDGEGRLLLGPDRFLLMVTPEDVANDPRALAAFMDGVRAVAATSVASEPLVRVAFTGAPALVVDEMTAARRDIVLGTVVSVALVAALFAAAFHSPRRIAFAVAALLAGLALTFGAARFLVGSLNLFSSVFAAVLAGTGIDFGIHVVSRHEARRAAGDPEKAAIRGALLDVGAPTALGAVTTSLAFFAIMTSGFRGFSQLGLVSGVGILLCLGTAFTLLPALLALSPPKAAVDHARARRLAARALDALLARPGLTFAASAAAVAAAAVLAGTVRFDHDLMALQPAGTEAAQLQTMNGAGRVTTHVAFSVATDLAMASRREAAFRRLGTVARTTSAASFLPSPDEGRAAALERLAAAAGAAQPAGGAGDGAGDAAASAWALASSARRLRGALRDAADLAFDADRVADADALERAADACARIEVASAGPAGPAGAARVGADLARLAEGLRARLPALAAAPLGPSDLPAALVAHLVGRTGRLAVLVEPKEAVWDRPALERFVADLRTVDPEVTGPPVQVLEVTETMRVSVLRASAATLVVVAIVVVLGLRSVLGAVIALASLGAGLVLMFGALAALRVPLNPANLVALPLILGLGVDAGIHVAHRWVRQRSVRAVVHELGVPLLLTSLTTVAGFAALVVASHRGVRSLGLACCVGALSTLVSALVVVPSVLALVESRRRHP